jgi:Ca-activated chloride channel family protein
VADPNDPNAADPTATEPPAVPKGAYAPAIIVLLTDGASNAGPDPIEAAAFAATRGIRVYTIGFGTEDPGDFRPTCGQQFIGNEPGDPGNGFTNGGGQGGGLGGGFQGGGGGFGGGGIRRAIDEETLTAVAEATGGEYYPAESADELVRVFDQLPTDLITKHEVTEVGVVFVAIGALFVSLAILLGQAWRPLP